MKKIFICTCLLLLGWMNQIQAINNVAKNCHYTLSPAPNYSLCSGSSDLSDLTDGKHANTVQLWISQAAVGWNSITEPIKITIDLGKTIPVNRVTFSTAGNYGGVKYPNFIDVEVSVDGKQYYTLGNLTALSKNRIPNVDAGYKNLTFDAEFSTVDARFVRLRCVPDSQYVFCDEIEIFTGDREKAKAITELPLALSDDQLKGNVNLRMVESYCQRRFENDLNTICLNLKRAEIDGTAQRDFLKQAKELSDKITRWRFSGDLKTFRAIVPFNDLHTEIYKLNGKIMQAKGLAPLALWICDRYDKIEPLQFPKRNQNLELTVAMMNNEHRATVLNLSNASEKLLTVRVKIKNLPVTVYSVEYVDSNSLELTPTALVKIDSEVTVPSGMTRQLWFSFSPQDLASGSHDGQIELTWDGTTRAVPVKLDIAQVRFPEQVSLATGLWDYLDFGDRQWSLGVNRNKLHAAIADQRDHLINITVAEYGIGNASKPEQLKIDAAGNIVGMLDFSKFDAWIKQWPDARNYFVFVNLNSQTKFGGSASPGTPIFDRAVKNWASLWNQHITELGLTQGRVIFQLLDEPRNDADYATVRQWTKSFKAGSKLISIYCNPLILSTGYQESIAQVDILSPLLDLSIENKNGEVVFLKKWADNARTLWFYKCDGGPFSAAPSYYRLQPWFCFKFRATGLGLWSYGETSGLQDNSWNQYLMKSTYYSPVLFDKNGITPTKHWEALREGIEDHEYLDMLRQSINKAEKSGNLAAAKDAKDLLQTAVQNVAQPANLQVAWRNRNTCAMAEEKRLEILNMLNRLEEKQ